MIHGSTVQLGTQPLTGFDSFGCEWFTTDLGGWGSPASTIAPVQRTRAPGAWLSPRQLTPRHLTPAGMVRAPSPDALRDALDRLAAAASLDGSLLAVTEGETTRSCMTYRADEVLTTWATDRVATWSLGLVAVDPRKYGAPIVAATGLPVTSGGVTFPIRYPVTFTGVAVSGIVHIDNPGNIAGPVAIRIDGPVTAPVIRHDTSGNELVFASSYDLPAGSFLEIDMERRTVLEGGTASRNQWVTSRGWFDLAPGGNDIVFDAQTYNSAARMTVTTAPTYQ